jgi:hypothetical protein
MDRLEITDPNLLLRMKVPKRQSRAKGAVKEFKAGWIKFPASWREALHRANSAGSTYDLALTILIEAFKREHVGGDIVLSATVTRMSESTRKRAVLELEKLGLIRLQRTKGRAHRVSLIIIKERELGQGGQI